MNVAELRKFAPEKLHRYPHMFPADVPVWERFLEMRAAEFVEFSYDVLVGKGIEPDRTLDREIQQLSVKLTKKRIDVVGFKEGSIWIIEVKEIATVSAPGQVLGYHRLYLRDFKPTIPSFPLLIFSKASRDVMTVASDLGVLWEQISV